MDMPNYEQVSVRRILLIYYFRKKIFFFKNVSCLHPRIHFHYLKVNFEIYIADR